MEVFDASDFVRHLSKPLNNSCQIFNVLIHDSRAFWDCVVKPQVDETIGAKLSSELRLCSFFSFTVSSLRAAIAT